MTGRNALMASAAAIALLAGAEPASAKSALKQFNHFVIIYQENHSFDNLLGSWGNVNGTPVIGLPAADPAHTLQVRQDNTTKYSCLLQNDVNLTSPSPLATTCTDNTGASFNSHFTNAPFKIDDFIASTDNTCPDPSVFAPNGVLKDSVGALPGGCTRDIVHRYYSEIYQIDKGKQDRYVTGSDAAGLVMGHYDSTLLPLYAYLHGNGAPSYVVNDMFFQGAYGGSFLNHQWLIAAATPVFAGALNDGSSNDLHSVVDVNGMPTSTPLYNSPLGASAKDSSLTASCSPPPGRPATPKKVVCGDYAINTTQPTYQPTSPTGPAARRLPPLTNPTIGDRLSDAGVDWAWYSGGWDNANGNVGGPGWTNGNTPGTCTDPAHNTAATYPYCPDFLFQFHHQAFNYFLNYAPGTPARDAHLLDEVLFIQAAQNGTLKPVSFVKPVGEENEHPGYGSEPNGSSHLVDLIRAVEEGPNADDTLIIVTYDEFGGQWDHVPPPPFGGTKSAHDQWGPGTRVPAILISKAFRHSAVDHTARDTTSIMKTLETRYGLEPIGDRDKKVKDLLAAINTANE
jgi:acid phosphatase